MSKVKRVLAVLSFSMVAMCFAGAAAYAETVESGLPERSKEELTALWHNYAPAFAGASNPFDEMPASQAPYMDGKLKQDYLQGGVKMANLYRFASGLPTNLIADELLAKQGQHGAVLNAAHNELSHTPSQPSDMLKSFYDLAYKSTSSSNIAYLSANSTNENILAYTVKMYMSDSDSSNIDRVGHRRWILSPQLQNVGFGLASSKQNNYFSTMQVFDTSGESLDYQYVPYPGAGNYPIELFNTTDAWSVQLNPAKFAKPDVLKVKVHMTRESDGRTWDLSSSNSKVDASSERDNEPYFHVETSGYGYSHAIIFRPGNISSFEDGDRYQVEITGLTYSNGSEADIAYEVNFFHLGAVTAAWESTTTATTTQFTGYTRMAATGEPRAGVAVKVFRANPHSGVVDNKVLLKKETGMDGSFHIQGLADGTYAIKLGNDDVIGDFQYRLTIEQGKAKEQTYQFILDEVDLYGKIVHKDGTPVMGAYVLYGGDGTGLYGVDTDEEGIYRISNLTGWAPDTLFFHTNHTSSSAAEASAKWDYVYKGVKITAPDVVVDGTNVELKETSGSGEGASQSSFTDINGHWGQAAIKRAAEAGITTGYPDGTFKPDRFISEAEFLTLFFNAFDVSLADAAPGAHWSDGAYQAAIKLQYPVSLPNEEKQDTAISRKQVAEIITGADGLHFDDNDAIQYILAQGYSDGKSGKTIEGYQGADSLTRAEALQFIFNLKDKGMEELQTRPTFESSLSLLPNI